MLQVYVEHACYGNTTEKEVKEFDSMDTFIDWVMNSGRYFSSLIAKDYNLWDSSTWLGYENTTERHYHKKDSLCIKVYFNHAACFGAVTSTSVVAIFENGKCLASRESCVYRNFIDFVSNTFIKEYAEKILEKNGQSVIEYAD